eukprot:scaffold302014_cov30-Tisochrysis_lutea.AAC.3
MYPGGAAKVPPGRRLSTPPPSRWTKAGGSEQGRMHVAIAVRIRSSKSAIRLLPVTAARTRQPDEYDARRRGGGGPW